MAKIVVPGALRALADGRSALNVKGANLGAIVQRLGVDYPELVRRLLDDEGELLPSVALFVDGVEIKAADGLFVPVDDDAEIVIVPAISGG